MHLITTQNMGSLQCQCFLAALAALYLTLYTYNRREPTYNHREPTYNHGEPTYNHREPTYNRGEPLTATLEIEDE